MLYNNKIAIWGGLVTKNELSVWNCYNITDVSLSAVTAVLIMPYDTYNKVLDHMSNVWNQLCVLRCQALTSMLLETEIFRDVTLCGWVSSCWCSKILAPSSERSRNPRRMLEMDCLTTLKMKALCSFKTPGNTHPTTVSHPWSLWLSVPCSRGTHNYTHTHTHSEQATNWKHD